MRVGERALESCFIAFSTENRQPLFLKTLLGEANKVNVETASGVSEQTRQQEASPRIWVVTDGKVGDVVQCVAVAKALGTGYEERTAAPRAPWGWMAPSGPIDPREAPHRAGSPLAPPHPDIVIASGRRSIPYALYAKRASGAFLIILKDPRIDPRRADLVWAPAHDRLQGPNVISTLTSPNALIEAIARHRETPSPAIAHLAEPFLGVIVGGPNGGARFNAKTAAEFAAKLNAARTEFAAVAVAPSRRTPPAFLARLRDALGGEGAFVWEGQGPNPYVDILARARSLIVTGDSHNMMSEALATGTGVYVWRPPGLPRKLEWFIAALEAKGLARAFEANAAPFQTPCVDATPEIVSEIQKRLARR